MMFKVNNKDTRTTSFDVVYVSDILKCDLTRIIFSAKMLFIYLFIFTLFTVDLKLIMYTQKIFV